jgi:hypothetical protein
LRHNPVDLAHVHIAPHSFQLLVAATSAACTGTGPVCAKGAVLSAPWSLLSLALLPADNKGQFAPCARGDFDRYWRRIGANLASYSAGRTVIVEPGWEANLGSALHPWGVDDISQADGFKNCWSHAVRSVKLTFPAAKIAWTNAKRFEKNFSVDDINPGTVPGTDALIDFYGLMYYDNMLPLNSQATWDKYVDAATGFGGSPFGIGAWLRYAKAHGKKLGISEWGVWWHNRLTAAQADDPVFVRNVYRFVAQHQPDVAYEAYQNNGPPGDSHKLCPDTPFPNSAAEYAADFSHF